MTAREVTRFDVTCDRCGHTGADHYTDDHYLWDTAEQALSDWTEGENHVLDDGRTFCGTTYCAGPSCLPPGLCDYNHGEPCDPDPGKPGYCVDCEQPLSEG